MPASMPDGDRAVHRVARLGAVDGEDGDAAARLVFDHGRDPTRIHHLRDEDRYGRSHASPEPSLRSGPSAVPVLPVLRGRPALRGARPPRRVRVRHVRRLLGRGRAQRASTAGAPGVVGVRAPAPPEAALPGSGVAGGELRPAGGRGGRGAGSTGRPAAPTVGRSMPRSAHQRGHARRGLTGRGEQRLVGLRGQGLRLHGLAHGRGHHRLQHRGPAIGRDVGRHRRAGGVGESGRQLGRERGARLGRPTRGAQGADDAALVERLLDLARARWRVAPRCGVAARRAASRRARGTRRRAQRPPSR